MSSQYIPENLLLHNAQFQSLLLCEDLTTVLKRRDARLNDDLTPAPKRWGNVNVSNKKNNNKTQKELPPSRDLFSKYLTNSEPILEWQRKKQKALERSLPNKALSVAAKHKLNQHDSLLAKSNSTTRLRKREYLSKHTPKNSKRRPRPQSAKQNTPGFSFGTASLRRTKREKTKALELQKAERDLQRAVLLKALALGYKHPQTQNTIKSLLSCYNMQRKIELFQELKSYPRRHLTRLRSIIKDINNNNNNDSNISESETETLSLPATTSPVPSPLASPALKYPTQISPPSSPPTSPSHETPLGHSTPPSPSLVPPSSIIIASPTKFRGKWKVRINQIVRLSLQNNDNRSINFKVGIGSIMSPVVLSWNATADDIEQVVLSLGHPNIGSVRATKRIQIKKVGMGNHQHSHHLKKNTGGSLAYNGNVNRWKFRSFEDQPAGEQLRPRYESRKVIEWNLELACYEPLLPLLCATAFETQPTKSKREVHANGEYKYKQPQQSQQSQQPQQHKQQQQQDNNPGYTITIAWAGRPSFSNQKKLRTKKTRLTEYLQQQNFTGAADLMRLEMQQTGFATENVLRVFHASIAQIRKYPKQIEFRASVKINVLNLSQPKHNVQSKYDENENANTNTNKNKSAMFNVGEDIAVSFFFKPDPNNPSQEHNNLDWIGLFAVEEEDVKLEKERQQIKIKHSERRRNDEDTARDAIQDPHQRKHMSPGRNKLNYVRSRTMNKKTLIARATVTSGSNSGTVYISQDPSDCRGITPGRTYVVCYCLHGSLCSIGNIVCIKARSVPVNFVVNTVAVEDVAIEEKEKEEKLKQKQKLKSTRDKKIYCGEGLHISYSYNYHHDFTIPSGDWVGLYCIRGGEESALSAQQYYSRQKISSESRPVLRYDLSSNLSGSVILEDQPLYPGEYQVVLWQVTPAGTIMLASSVVLHATLHDSFMQTKEKDYQRQREIRIFLSSSLVGCAADIEEIRCQLLPKVMELADNRKVALSILDLHSEFDAESDTVSDLIQKNLELQNACRPHGIYLINTKKYGQVLNTFSTKTLYNHPWLNGSSNKMLRSKIGASLVEIELVSGLLVPQCIRPELRDGSIVCIQDDIAYESKENNVNETGEEKGEGRKNDKKNDKKNANKNENDSDNTDAALDFKDRASNASNKMVTNYIDSNSLCASLQGHLFNLIATEYPKAQIPSSETIIAYEMDSVVRRLGGECFVEEDNEIFETMSHAFNNYIVNRGDEDDEEKEVVLPLSVVSETTCGKSSSVAKYISFLSTVASPEKKSKKLASGSVSLTAKETIIEEVRCFVLVTFIGVSRAASTIIGVMWRVCAELKRHFDMIDTMPETMKDVQTAFNTWPARCAQASGLRIVLIFDDIETFVESSRPYAHVKQEETRVGANFVNSIVLPLHPEVRIITTCITQSKAFDATSNSSSNGYHFNQLRLPRSHVMDSHEMIYAIAENHKLPCSEDIIHLIEARSSTGKPLTWHGLLSFLHLMNYQYKIKNTENYEIDNSNDEEEYLSKPSAAAMTTMTATTASNTSNATPVVMPEGLSADEKITWELLHVIILKYPRFELLMCLLLCSQGGLTEHIILECFTLVSTRKDVLVNDTGWTNNKPLQEWLALRKTIQPYIANIVCGRWKITSSHIQRVGRHLL